MTDWIGVDVNDGICARTECTTHSEVGDLCRRHYNAEYAKERRKRLRDEWIAQGGGACVNCGSTERLEIDHIDPSTKTREIAGIWTCSIATRVAELAKCQILCRTCHEIKTKSELQGPHGRPGRYAHGCRCEECRTAESRRTKEVKNRRRVAA